MQALDTRVVDVVLNPDDATKTCDPIQFRRWAIKVAIMRSTLDHSGIIPREDRMQLYAGEDVSEWRIFVGRVDYPHLRDTFAGTGGHFPDDGPMEGLIQVSWCVGTTLVICLREGQATKNHLSEGFKDFCRGNGNNFAEVLPDAQTFPALSSLIPLRLNQLRTYFWFFSTDPVSPVRDQMTTIQATIRRRNIKQGYPEYGS